jgi:hypothetical protein
MRVRRLLLRVLVQLKKYRRRAEILADAANGALRKDSDPPARIEWPADDLWAMRAPKKKPTAEKLKAWRASLLRSATTSWVSSTRRMKSAEAAAIAEFKIAEDMRRRLIVRPDDDWAADPVA